jgi:glucose/arabinose dehydrogenase
MLRSLWPRRWIVVAAWWFAALLSLAGTAAAQPALSFQPVVSGLSSPLGIVNAHDGSNRLFIVEKGGLIKIYNSTQVLATPFLDISAKIVTDSERGLLGLAFDANYSSNGLFYIYYTSAPNGTVTISRYSVSASANVADPNSEVVLKTQDHSQFGNHDGGSLLFGPDGCLYAGIGDGGSGGDPNGNGQNLNTLLAKIIRINPTDGAACSAAPGNPFVGQANVRDEIWALGVRNPWRITFDRQTGDLLIADVGEDIEEELDIQPPGIGGRNYCWRHKEGLLIYDAGTACTAGIPTDPVLVYDHTNGRCAITGGYRYRGSRIPDLNGTYFYGDYCTGEFWGATESGGVWSSTRLLDTPYNISTFGEDESGEIYLADITGGAIYKLVDTRTATHDFNGDGFSDIAWRNTNSDLAIWLMNGTTVSSPADLGGVPNSWSVVGQRDFDGDGKADLLWRNTNGDLAVWFMNGTAVSSTFDFGLVPTSWSVAGTGDFNNDGKGAILWRNTNGDVAIWLMNGTTVLSAVDLGGVDLSWTIAGSTRQGILWRNTNGDTSLWLMNGTSIASTVDYGGVPLSWTVAGVGDFNGDGNVDILWRNSNGDVAMWFLNSSGAVASGVDLGGVDPSWSIAETGDFNGDGMSDILWRNTNGDTAIWLMNGTTISSGVDLGLVPTSWSIQGANGE